MNKDNPNERYDEMGLVLRADGDIMTSDRVGRRGSTWDIPDLGISPPAVHPPVPLYCIGRQGYYARHSGRVIPIMTESTPASDNPSIVNHAVPLAAQDAAAGRTRGQMKDDATRARINLILASTAAIVVIGTVLQGVLL